MRQLRSLVVLGVVLVTLLLIIDTIDAGKKEGKKKEVDSKNEDGIGNAKNEKYGKLKKSENIRAEKPKKLKEQKHSNSDQSKGECKLEINNSNGKRGIKCGTKERKNIKVVNPKITKTYQKVKKYKVVEDVPAKKVSSNKKTAQINKSQRTYKKEVVDEVCKSLKRTSQKNIPIEENSHDDVLNGEQNNLNEENTIFVEEESSGNNHKIKKYKLVEVMFQDDEENHDNETMVEGSEDEDYLPDIQRTESEEVIEKFKTTQTLKLPKTKNEQNHEPNIYEAGDEEDLNVEDHLHYQDENSEPLERNDMYLDGGDENDPNTLQNCKPLPEDPNRQGPKKLSLYVIEEEIDGQIKKRVVSEENGVTMCEIASLLDQNYAGTK